MTDRSGRPPPIPDHVLLTQIGAGGYGEVWLARNVMGSFRAVKLVFRSRFETDEPYEREFRGIRQFEPISRDEDSQIDILHVGRNDEERFFYYIMELADDVRSGRKVDPACYQAKTLQAVLSERRSLKLSDCVDLGIALAIGIEHLHKHELIHRDIKPANIIYVNGKPKLADIGLVANTANTVSLVGTEGFIPSEGPGSKGADIFAVGKVLYLASFGLGLEDYPALPTDLDTRSDRDEVLELNAIILKACAENRTERYPSAEAMARDLVLIKNGKSVRRLQRLERQFRRLSRIGTVVTIIALFIGIAYVWQRRQTLSYRALAAENRARLVQAAASNQESCFDKGEAMNALAWCAESLRLESDSPIKSQLNRRQMAFAMKQFPELVQCWWHDDIVNSLEFHPDGRMILTASGDGTARLWDLRSGAEFAAAAHAGAVRWAAFDASGARFLTAGDDGFVNVWGISNGVSRVQSLRHAQGVNMARFDPSGNRIAVTCNDAVCRVWNLRASSSPPIVLTESNRISDVAWSPDGSKLATAAYWGVFRIWDPESGEASLTRAIAHGLHRVLFSPNGSLMVVAGANGTWYFRTDNYALIKERGHYGGKVSAAFSPDGTTVLEADSTGEAAVVHSRTGTALAHLPSFPRTARNVVFSRDGSRCLIVVADGTVILYDVKNRESIGYPIQHAARIIAGDFSPDGSLLATASEDGHIKVWNLVPLLNSHRHLEHRDAIYQMRVSPDGQFVLTASRDGNASVWNARTGDRHIRPVFHGAGATDGAFSSDARYVATAGLDGAVRVHDLGSKKPWKQFMHSNSVYRIAYVQSTNRLVTVSGSAISGRKLGGNRITTVAGPLALHVWDPAEGTLLLRTNILEANANGLIELSENGRYAALAVNETSVSVWDVLRGETLSPEIRPNRRIQDACVSPNGSLLVTISNDNETSDTTAQTLVWDVATGAGISDLSKANGAATRAFFSADSKLMATAGRDGSVNVWDMFRGTQAARRLSHPFVVNAVDFSQDGSLIACAGGTAWSGHVVIWNLRTHERFGPVLSCERAPRSVRFLGRGKGIVASMLEDRAYSALSTHVWDLDGDRGSVGFLRNFVSMVTSSEITSNGILTRIDPSRARLLWGEFQAEQRNKIEALSEDVSSWHRFEAGAAERRHDWVCARVHLEELAKISPNDASLSNGLVLARELCRSASIGELVIPRRLMTSDASHWELNEYFNGSLSKGWMPDSKNGLTEEKTLPLPLGTLRCEDVSFDIRGVVQLKGSAVDISVNFPQSVQLPIKKPTTFRRIHFLHGVMRSSPVDTPVGSYEIEYMDGTAMEVPILYGKHVRDWIDTGGEDYRVEKAHAAWIGLNEMSRKVYGRVRIFHFAVENARSETPIRAVKFVAAPTGLPFLISVTGEP